MKILTNIRFLATHDYRKMKMGIICNKRNLILLHSSQRQNTQLDKRQLSHKGQRGGHCDFS